MHQLLTSWFCDCLSDAAENERRTECMAELSRILKEFTKWLPDADNHERERRFIEQMDAHVLKYEDLWDQDAEEWERRHEV